MKDISSFKRFDWNLDKAPTYPGVYFMLLKNGVKYPDTIGTPEFRKVLYNGKEYRVLYVGKAESGIQERIEMHFYNNDASWSTVRKSLGCLFGMQRAYRRNSKGEVNKKSYLFTNEEEEKLSSWMKENIIYLYTFCPRENCVKKEDELINEFYPPINIDKNTNPLVIDYVKKLRKLRRNNKSAL